MSLDIDVVKQVVADLYITKIAAVFKQPGVNALKRLLEDIRRLYVHFDPGSWRRPIVIIKTLTDTERPISAAPTRRIIDLLTVHSDVRESFVLQMLDGGEALLWNSLDPDCAGLSGNALVYRYHDGVETIFAGGEASPIPRLMQGVPSVFAIPTFTELRAALEHYRVHVARNSGCKILENAWHDATNRIFFRNKPEFSMRDSLCQYLSNCLRGVEVRPEQKVDEDHPVDIKATWVLARRLALIEVKWLGISKDINTGLISTRYSEARAREGAKQIAEYLNMNKQAAATHLTKGWLVIFDARRKGVDQSTTSIDDQDGGHFRDREIDFDPKYETIRDDFEPPVRFFLEPVCTP